MTMDDQISFLKAYVKKYISLSCLKIVEYLIYAIIQSVIRKEFDKVRLIGDFIIPV